MGVGFRHLLGDGDAIIGANVYYDRRKSKFDNSWRQWGAGLEFLSEWVDVRFNYYDPEDINVLLNEAAIQTLQVDTSVGVETSRRYANTSTREQTGFSSNSTASNVAYSGNNLTGNITTTNVTSFRDTSTRTVWTTTRQTTTTVNTTTDLFFEQFEGGLEGWDAELGIKMPLPDTMPEVRVFGGYYDFDKPFGGEIKGPKGRLEVRAGPYFTVDAEVFDDEKLNDTRWFLGARLHLPMDLNKLFKGENPFSISKHRLSDFRNRPLKERMDEDVIRDVRIQTEESEFSENRDRRRQHTDTDVDVQEQTVMQSSTTVEEFSVTSVTSGSGTVTRGGDALTIVHIDDNNTGDPNNDGAAALGTYENPHVDADTAVTGANDNALDADIILVHGGSTITGGDIQADDDDSVLGEGGGVTLTVSSDQGSIALPETAPGAQAGAVPTIPGVDISSNNVQVNNFTVTNGTVTTTAGGNHSNISIQNITFNGGSGGVDSIELGQGGGTLGGTVTLNNITVNGGGTGHNGIDINNVLAGAVINGSNITVNNSGDDGLDLDDIASGAVLNFTNIALNGSGDEGLNIDLGHGTFTFSNLDIGGSVEDGIQLTNSNGSFTFDAASSVATSGEDGIFIGGGAPTFSFAGTVNHTAGQAVQILGTTASTSVTFGGMITGNTGATAAIDLSFNDGGTFTFNGGLDIDTTSGIGIWLDNNDGTSFTFNNMLDADTTTGDALLIEDNDGSTFAFTAGVDTNSTAGEGIDLFDNDNSLFTFSGFVDIDTTSGTGFLADDNDGSTVSFNGGLDIDTTSGLGFDAFDGGTFNVAATAGDESIRTDTGVALLIGDSNFPDTQTVNITFDSINVVTSTNSTNPFVSDESIQTRQTGGSLTINSGTIAAPNDNGTSAIGLNNNTGGGAFTVNLNNMTTTGAAEGGAGVHIVGGAGSTITVNLSNTNVTGGAGTGNNGGGAGVRATQHANITLDATSTATGGAAVSGGGGSGIGDNGADSGNNGNNFSAGSAGTVTVNNAGTATGGNSTNGGGGAGIGGSGAGDGATTGGTAPAGGAVTNTGTATGGAGAAAANNGDAVGAGGDG